MPAKRDVMTTQSAQSLPSFAQAFSSPSLHRISQSSNALPPLHRLDAQHDRGRQSPNERVSPQHNMELRRKRLHADIASPIRGHDGSDSEGRRSPRTARSEEEADRDAAPTTTSTQRAGAHEQQPGGSQPDPPPSQPDTRSSPLKRRRVTISGTSHPINTNVKTTASENISTISPVVMGLTIQRDDPNALEQVRSMLSVKQKQKELIEQRRGSTASIVSTAPPTVNIVNALLPPDDRQITPKLTAALPRGGRRSPNVPQNSLDRRRSVIPSSSTASQNASGPSNTRHTSPNSFIASSQPPLPPPPAPGENPPFVHNTTAVSAHALPAPPISFAHRRAGRQLGGAKGKPADIVISPLGPQSENLQPVIQSAPPIPRAEQALGASARYPSMAIPSIPQISGSAPRHTSGRVPPTPTRLSNMPRTATTSHFAQPSIGGSYKRSPQNASVPIASSLVPPTPTGLNHPAYSGEKSAFLEPFSMFYDALVDAKSLKHWLNEQVQKAQALNISLQRQQEQLHDIVETAVEKRTATMREDIYVLHRRIEELEYAFRRAAAPAQSYSAATSTLSAKGKGKANGAPAHPIPPDSYTFPPVDPHLRRLESIRRAPSPIEYDARSFPNSETASPVPFDVGRRLSVSAIRMDPRSPVGAHAEAVSAPQRKTFGVPTSASRDLQGPAFPPPPAGGYAGKDTRSPKVVHSTAGASSSRSHLHPSEEAGGSRKPAGGRAQPEVVWYREGKGSPASSDGRSEGAVGTLRREGAVMSPSGSRSRSPVEDDA
ncbi:uncharacterized protein LAESUDRAFT_696093 [Laetiporus sulphureus 93-53]|uniref:Uncharacterized protein n=1 Tax=Laetiporus sulphureus 93-53 TaxID=1314785 RepID=A0A165FSA0_9APHY|nr:uncharacterized protein LAESUDRAFT_696093 [Laetiporus sulphureus 93-53]KZT09346.1 hypothetical protein LAESUDRAFT_696093 [Laetiporus sulphureus 93-53]